MRVTGVVQDMPPIWSHGAVGAGAAGSGSAVAVLQVVAAGEALNCQSHRSEVRVSGITAQRESWWRDSEGQREHWKIGNSLKRKREGRMLEKGM